MRTSLHRHRMTNAHGYTFFDTAIGSCALAWGARGIVAVWLPESSEAALRTRVVRRLATTTEGEPPGAVRAAIERIRALLDGACDDLADIALDMADEPAFHRRVYEAARGIPPGATRTYGEIARDLGEPGAARAVGQALGRNPFPIVVPCHRVLGAGGRSGGFSAPGGVRTKLRLLEIEQARLDGGDGLFD
jgi:methylated-DNA-[protein]-cysteine S-methyltransferase